MFGGKQPNYTKLRTNLRLCINRLKLLEKKKSELALKARKEIADYIAVAKDDRARIRVEHIIREDYLVEAMEIVEMLCDLVLARFGLIERMKEMDPGLEESIATLIWVTPRLCSDIAELREVTNQLTLKYGKEYADMCRRNELENVNEKVMHKLSSAAPPKMLVENYMVEIAKVFKVPFEPDAAALCGDSIPEVDDLISLGNELRKPPNDGQGFGGFGSPGGGFGSPGGGFGSPGGGFGSPGGSFGGPGGGFGSPGGGYGSPGGGGGGGFVSPGGGFGGPGGGGGGGSGGHFMLPSVPSPGAPVPENIYLTIGPNTAPAQPVYPDGYNPPKFNSPSLSPGQAPVFNIQDQCPTPPRSPGPPPLPSRPPNASQGNSPITGNSPNQSGNSAAYENIHITPPHNNGNPQLPKYDDVMRSPGQYPQAHAGVSSNTSPQGGLPSAPIPSPRISPNRSLTPNPAPRGASPARSPSPGIPQLPDIPGLPSVPSGSVNSTAGEEVDFDDLTRRFEELKRRK